MSKYPKTPEATRDKIFMLSKQGKGAAEIAAIVGINKATARKYMAPSMKRWCITRGGP